MIEAKCDVCYGTGKQPGTLVVRCTRCGGTGEWPRGEQRPRRPFRPDYSQDITGKSVPLYTGEGGPEIADAFARTRTAKEIISFRDAIDAVLPTHPAFIKMRHQRNCCFFFAIAFALWTLFSILLASRL